jgi:hypothetical protein
MHRTPRAFALLSAAAMTTAVLAATPASAAEVVTGHTGSGRPALAIAFNRTYIAWAGSTGTAGKQLIVGWSTDQGRTITKDNTIVERIPAGVGPALDADGAIGYSLGVYVAWPAANNGNTLTAGYTLGNGLKCRTAFPGVTTTQSPAMAHDAFGHQYLAWVAPSGHVTIGRLDTTGCAGSGTPGGMVLTDRVTLADTSISGVSLSHDIAHTDMGIAVGWTTADHVGHLARYDAATAGLTNRTGWGAGSELTTGGFSVTFRPGTPYGGVYVWFAGTDGNLHRAFSEGYNPIGLYSFAWGAPVSGGVGATYTGTGGDVVAWFNPSGRLEVYTQ